MVQEMMLKRFRRIVKDLDSFMKKFKDKPNTLEGEALLFIALDEKEARVGVIGALNEKQVELLLYHIAKISGQLLEQVAKHEGITVPEYLNKGCGKCDSCKPEKESKPTYVG